MKTRPADQEVSFSTKLKDNEESIKSLIGHSYGLTIRYFDIPLKGDRKVECQLVFINGLIDEKIIDQFILTPLQNGFPQENSLTIQAVKQKIYSKGIIETDQLLMAAKSVLRGNSLLLLNGSSTAFSIDTYKPQHRAIEEPPDEIIVKGPSDGFIENISINIALLRRRLPHPNLQFEEVTVGNYSETKVVITYIKDIAQMELVERVKKRLMEIKIDNVPSAGEIEQLIEDDPFTIFPTIGNTQRPDKTAAVLVEGRVAIFFDGTPVVLYVPHLFFESIQSPDDYSHRPVYASFIRFLRFIGLLLSTLAPSFFIASSNFQKEMIPTSFIQPLIEAREKVSIPLPFEVIFMILVFEILREAGVRMPKPINQSLSIVGALVLGDVAVMAGLVGAPTMVIVSISAIFAFVITPITEVISVLRIALLIPTIFLGVYGLVISSLIVLTHTVKLTSMGVPYMAPLAPTYFSDWKDFFIRAPIQWFKKRPQSVPSMKKLRLRDYPGKR